MQNQNLNFFSLFRFANTTDKFKIFFGVIAAVANGATTPFFSLIMGTMTDSFGPTTTGDEFVDVAWKFAKYYFYVGAASFVFSLVSFYCWMSSGERQTVQFKSQYYKAMLNQPVEWYDKVNIQTISTDVLQQTQDFQNAIGEKIATGLQTISMTTVSFLIGLIRGWKLAIILCSVLPILALTGFFFVFYFQNYKKIALECYSGAGGVAEQALSQIKTVKALCGEEHEKDKYQKMLTLSVNRLLRYILFASISIGVMFLSILGLYPFGFYFGVYFVKNDFYNDNQQATYGVGDVLVIFFSVIVGGFTLGQLPPCFKAYTAGVESIKKAYPLMFGNREGKVYDDQDWEFDGTIQFKNVSFSYPTQPEKKVLNNFNLSINKNSRIALVGESGSGKSTICQLIEAFYYPDEGEIIIGNKNIRDIDPVKLRQKIGYVGQEPVLFELSIRDNFLLVKPDATEKDIIEVLKRANAWEFIYGLEKGIDTYVGSMGLSQLSGGQKQRIAIARSLLKDPVLLIFDEATSALDSENEQLILEQLKLVSEGLTTLTVAHRLATIIHSEHVIVMKDGQLSQNGTHQQLLNSPGLYQDLYQQQMIEQQQMAINYGQNDKERKKSTLQSEVFVEEALESRSLLTQLFAIMKYKSSPFLIILGIVGAIVNGASLPTYAIYLGEIMVTLAQPESPDFSDKTNTIIYSFIVIAILGSLANFIQSFCFTYYGEMVTQKLRFALFDKYIYMPLSFFDNQQNSTGALNSKLANDISTIRDLCSSVIGIIIQAISAFVVGIVISSFSSWQLTLISLAMSPVIMIASKIQANLAQGFSNSSDSVYRESSNIMTQTVGNIRTVYALNAQTALQQKFDQSLSGPLKSGVKRGLIAGSAFGFSQFSQFANYGITFYLGAIFFKDKPFIDREKMYKSVFALIYAAFGSGYAFQFMPDLGKSKDSANYFMTMRKAADERQLQIQEPKHQIGNVEIIEFSEVTFKYRDRKQIILDKLNLKILPNQKIGIIGKSGSGKSTILQLLMRFYEPSSGEILINKINIQLLTYHQLRKVFGVVWQEPVLFQGSIKYNMIYNLENISNQQVVEYSKKVNAYDFITQQVEDQSIHEFDNLQQPLLNKELRGFDREVGPKGSKLSGGQKQRIAIGRAIMREPQVLLLDEATSALDSKNESEVQSSIDKLMVQTTSVIISHRISTIKNADKIILLHQGKIEKEGKFEDFMDMLK